MDFPMSKLACHCGHIIRDQSDQLPFKATVIRDRDEGRLLEKIGEAAVDLVAAAKEGNIDQLIANRFGPNWRPSFRVAVEEIVTQPYTGEISIAYECEACGRLWLNRKGSNAFLSYSPDSNRYEGVLSPADMQETHEEK